MWFKFQLALSTLAKKSFVIANIYRPPNLSSSIFLEKLLDLVANLYVDTNSNLLLLGDLNSPGSSLDTFSDALSTFLSSFNLTKLVYEPTCGKNLLDMVAADDPAAILDMKVDDCGLISDHRLIIFKIRTFIHLRN